MSTWPETLPVYPLADSYDESWAGGVLRTPMDAGPAKVRRLVSNSPVMVAVGMYLDDSQLATFTTLFNTTLLKTGRFDWVHPRTDAAIESRIVTDDSRGIRIGEKRGDYYRVDFLMEILP